eukprot:TRINITY_DN24093_c0_g1_i1.p2 TRINITY_DN24093_c0_g1~~TRINITY_DN24093_c0_g1_i1.p2  ORF type:complete len:171 (+),score=49.42 TRINITY_DN24093_c0_g1_i1:174-686(+)
MGAMCSSEAPKAPQKNVKNHFLVKSAPRAMAMAKNTSPYTLPRVGKRPSSVDGSLCAGDDELMRLESAAYTDIVEVEAEAGHYPMPEVDAADSSTASVLSPTLPLASSHSSGAEDDELLEQETPLVREVAPPAGARYPNAYTPTQCSLDDDLIDMRSRASSRASTPARTY